MMVWQPGEQIVMRARIGRTWSLTIPTTVAADEPDQLLLFIAAETPCMRLDIQDMQNLPRVLSPEQIAQLPRSFVKSAWGSTHLLHVTPTGQGYSVYMKWSAPDWEFLGWYVNMQVPLRRLRRIPGIEVEDLFLDIVVDPDLSWRWKDEDELVEAVHVGRLSAEQAIAIRAGGERVAAMIDKRMWPFTSEAAAWRPDPEWPIPELSADWDQT